MHRLEILSVAKTNCEEAYARISCLGGRASDGRAFRLAAEDAIRALETGSRSLFVRWYGREHDLVIEHDSEGNKLLRIEGDDTPSNALWFLPECPPTALSQVFL